MIDASLAAPPEPQKLDLVLGHRVSNYYLEFPHVCPGESCAIAKWVLYKVRGERYWRGKRKTSAAE